MADLPMIPFAIGMVAVAAFVLVAAAMLRLGIRAFRASRQQQLQTQRVVDSLGFTAVEDPAWAETLSAHFWEPPTNRPYVCGLAQRPGPGHTAWMFRLYPPADGLPSAVAIQSAHLKLPRFLLLPALTAGQASVAVASDRYLHELMGWDDPPVRHSMISLNGTRHTLSAPNVTWVEPIFDDRFRAWLATTEGLALSGQGDFLVVWLGWKMSLMWGPVLERNPEKGLRFAETCYEHLRSRNP